MLAIYGKESSVKPHASNVNILHFDFAKNGEMILTPSSPIRVALKVIERIAFI